MTEVTQLAQTLAKEVMQRCDYLATFSESPDGLTRTYLSAPMHDTHDALIEWMEAVGMSVEIDAVGNIIGTYAASNDSKTKTLLIGSHLDTVKNAGKYDGIIGVLLGLALTEYCYEQKLKLPFNIKVLGFSEEEGIRFSMPFIGSKAITGTLDKAVFDRLDDDEISMREVITNFGKDANNLADCKLDASEMLGFIEIHHEQSRNLDKQGKSLGIVSAIVGQSRAKLSFQGKAGHAGTENMFDRKDALVAAAEFILAVEQIGQETDGLVATVGQCSVTPNAVNVIPALAELSLDVRHASDEIRTQIFERCNQKAEEITEKRNLSLEWSSTDPQKAIDMDKTLSDIMRRAAPDAPTLVSGAGHDAMVLASFCPTTLLFIRDPLGLSHHPDETVEVEDVAVTIEALGNFVKELSKEMFEEVKHV